MKIALKIIVPFIIIGVALFGFSLLKKSKPEPQSRQPEEVIPQVEIVRVSPTDHSPPVLSFGTVQPLFETTLAPQLSGQIIRVSERFRTGRRVKAGELLVEIDPTDFEAALAQLESNKALAEQTLAEEKIRAQQAREDWKASGRDLAKASPFVLREPQLTAAEASIAGSQAAIEKARADLTRTRIVSPFDAIVTTRSASVGNSATPNTVLGILVSTEAAEVPLPLTAQEFARVALPTEAVLTSPTKPGLEWFATIERLSPTVDRNQTVTAIAEIKTPYESAEKSLPVGTFVNASIAARPIENSYRISETSLINDSFIWTVTSEDTLERIKAQRVYTQKGDVFIRLVDEVDGSTLRVIARPLTNFENGMKVQPVEGNAEPLSRS